MEIMLCRCVILLSLLFFTSNVFGLLLSCINNWWIHMYLIHGLKDLIGWVIKQQFVSDMLKMLYNIPFYSELLDHKPVFQLQIGMHLLFDYFFVVICLITDVICRMSCFFVLVKCCGKSCLCVQWFASSSLILYCEYFSGHMKYNICRHLYYCYCVKSCCLPELHCN